MFNLLNAEQNSMRYIDPTVISIVYAICFFAVIVGCVFARKWFGLPTWLLIVGAYLALAYISLLIILILGMLPVWVWAIAIGVGVLGVGGVGAYWYFFLR